MSNSYSTICTALALKAVSTISTVLAPFGRICSDLTPTQDENQNPAWPRKIPVVTAVSATQTGPTIDYTAGDATINPVTITNQLFVQPFGVPSDEWNLGARLDWLAEKNAATFSETIADQISALLTVANYGAAAVTKSSANFATGDFEALYCAVPTPDRAIILASPYFAKVKPQTWLPPGFNSVYEHTRWASADPNVQGFVADKRAVAITCARPQIARPGRDVVSEVPFTIPQLSNLQCAASVYFITATRTLRAAYSAYFACGVADGNALKLLASA